MSDLSRHVERATCRCTRCMLVQCEVLPDHWPEWQAIDFAADSRVMMALLTRREPPV
jgi:transcription initiation factor TFIIIB Brf1 subunit/transcription initiation factor TFIIB